MPTMTVTITDVPSFAAVGIGYKFTGKLSLPSVVDGAIKISSMKLAFGYGRTYKVAPFLNVTCGDTSFRTDYFTISETDKSSVKERTMSIISSSIVVGNDHILRKNGRTITFVVARNDSTSSNVIDRPGAYNGSTMTLTVNYTVLQSGLTLDKAQVEAGQPLTAAIKAGDSAYAHKLTYTAGSRSEVMELEAGVGSAVFTPPMEWLEEIPRSTELAATCRLDTYSGETLMGSEEKSFTILCPQSVVPTCQVTAQPVNGFDGLYLGGRSSVELEVTEEAGAYGSTVVGYQLTGGGYAQYLKHTTFGPLAQGEMTFTAQVTDSRGRVGKQTVTITVLPYAAPTLSAIEVYRSNGQGAQDDSGAYIAAKAMMGFASLEGHNSGVLQARYRASGGTWSPWETMTSGEMTLLGEGALLATVSYEAQLQATDAVGNRASYTQRIPTAQVAFNLKAGGNGAAFGMYQEHDKRLSIPDDWRYYRGDVDIEGLIQAADEKAAAALEAAGRVTFDPLDVYPVGALYWSADPTSPASLFGGTWTQIEDKFVLAAGSTYANGDTGGADSQTVNFSNGYARINLNGGGNLYAAYKTGKCSANFRASVTIKTVDEEKNYVTPLGGSQSLSTLPPYLVRYCWERTA